MPTRVDVTITGPGPYWSDPGPANDEPDCCAWSFLCEAPDLPSVRRIQFGLCYRGWAEKIEDVDGFENLAPFQRLQPGETLEVTFDKPSPKGVVVLSAIHGHVDDRGPVFYPDSFTKARILRMRHTALGWEIGNGPDPNLY